MKKYIEVLAKFDLNGKIIPLMIKLDDEKYDVDIINDIRPAASLKSGGAGTRYTCNIMGLETYLFLDDTKWFIESPSC
ncbi:MAG: hypothetical protein LIO43_04320 [Clostridiales bacterium]|nr:hypothetical protein [Clostridiales bacterium]MCD7872160.1 hypothetical protein [Clostridiales bacterium]